MINITYNICVYYEENLAKKCMTIRIQFSLSYIYVELFIKIHNFVNFMYTILNLSCRHYAFIVSYLVYLFIQYS